MPCWRVWFRRVVLSIALSSSSIWSFSTKRNWLYGLQTLLSGFESNYLRVSKGEEVVVDSVSKWKLWKSENLKNLNLCHLWTIPKRSNLIYRAESLPKFQIWPKRLQKVKDLNRLIMQQQGMLMPLWSINHCRITKGKLLNEGYYTNYFSCGVDSIVDHLDYAVCIHWSEEEIQNKSELLQLIYQCHQMLLWLIRC